MSLALPSVEPVVLVRLVVLLLERHLFLLAPQAAITINY